MITALRPRAITFWTVALVYAIASVLLLAPVLAYPIRADDAYWVLQMPASADGSLLDAYFRPFLTALDFEGQPRSTAAAYGERRVAAVIVMGLATWLVVHPAVIWAAMKVVLLVAVGVALVVFLHVFRFRVGENAVRLSARARLLVILFLPVVVLTSTELETVELNNGWVFYPNLTYTPIVWYLMISSVLILLGRLVRRRPGIPASVIVVLCTAGLGVFLNFAYEVVALAVPLGVALVIADPVTGHWRDRASWGSKALVVLPFGGAYTLLFLWIRFQASLAPCVASGSCYEGTVLDVSPRALVYNVLGALPASAPARAAVAAVRDGELGAILPSVLVAFTAAAGAMLCWTVLSRRESFADSTQVRARADRIGLAQLAAIMVAIALGISTITGITEKAVDRLAAPISPYRSGPTVWIALSIAIIALAIIVMDRLASGVARKALIVSCLVGIAVLAGSQHWDNLRFAHGNAMSRTVLIDQIHSEIARGDFSAEGNDRRCRLEREFRDADVASDVTTSRILDGAQQAFAFHHGVEFCRTDPR